MFANENEHGREAGRLAGNEQRRAQIVDLVRRQGFVSIESLAQRFAVTPQTVRRDINALCDQAVLQRHHGGAALASSVENIAYPDRQAMCIEEKRRIARLVASHIPDHASLFINIGTTTEEIAKNLLRHVGLRVITNNLNVAALLCGKADFQVTVAGGVVRARDRGIVGEATIDLIRQFRVDFGVIGISGIDLDGTLLDFDYQEVRVAQAIIANSRQVFLAADHSKFGRNALVRLGGLEDVDALFTNAAPPPALQQRIDETEVALFVAEAP
jgi:DeoR family transcriptional regulator, glycerol-3-phosphate regulon repressor